MLANTCQDAEGRGHNGGELGYMNDKHDQNMHATLG